MALRGEDVLAGPIVRRVTTDTVAVWIAFGAPVSTVTLKIYAHGTTETDARATGSAATYQLGKGLWVALPTIRLDPGQHLLPGTMFEYELELEAEGTYTLQSLKLLEDGTIGDHQHLALGYGPNLRPRFITPPATPGELKIVHGSCRRPYAQGLDALVALDQLIASSPEGGQRPHYLFLTGDQIYADDLSNEMLGWASAKGIELIGKNSAGHPIEQLRVDLPDDQWTRTVKFLADTLHFPPGRRARICGRAARLTSDDNQNHAMAFGEIASHYLMSWCNVTWPSLIQQWKALYQARGDDVQAYLERWKNDFLNAQAAATPGADLDAAHVKDRLPYLHGDVLLPKPYRAIDQFRNTAKDDWNGAEQGWTTFWAHFGVPALRPDSDTQIGQSSGIAKTAFPEAGADLTDLANLLTPSWYAGVAHYGVTVDDKYKVGGERPPSNVTDIDLLGDDVLLRLDRLRCFYEGLPYARRALANVSTLMMFDDHEVTDDFAVSLRWRRELSARSLGRDIMTNALAAYLVFQDWGNVPSRYTDGSMNQQAFDQVCKMFMGPFQPLDQGPPDDVRKKLQQLFGFDDAPELPLEQQVTWNFSLTPPSGAPYEIITLDNRTKRGYDTSDSSPADLSIDAIHMQVPASPPTADAIAIVIAPLPVVGFPPMEEIAQPLSNLMQSRTEAHEVSLEDTFPEVRFDYKFGKLIADPEAWAFSTKAQEELLNRLSSRKAVILLSGDIHFALTGKVTYWQQRNVAALGGQPGLEPKCRLVQLISSAIKNEPGGMKQAMVQLAIAEQLGAVIGGPYDRLGWQSGGLHGPQFDISGAPYQLELKMRSNPAVVPVRMLNTIAKTQLRNRTMSPPPEWAWRFDIVKDTRDDSERYAQLPGANTVLPTEHDLVTNRAAALQQIAQHHRWHGRFGFPRRSFFSSNVGLVELLPDTDPGAATGDLVVVHSLLAFDRSVKGPRGTTSYDTAWPKSRSAFVFTQYKVPLRLTDETAPDQPDSTDPQT